MTRRSLSDWQLPPGVSRGVWDYTESAHIATEYDQYFADHAMMQLDRDIVSPSHIRTVLRHFHDVLFTELYPARTDGIVPKTLIFAKDDNHAENIVRIVREEFAKGNDFCQKITYRAKRDPEDILQDFRNSYYPRIAVTVDMIATGTDVRPLECLLFMRDVRSRNYFEQMKGRGTRVLDYDELRKVTPSAATRKTHFVIIDAVGVVEHHPVQELVHPSPTQGHLTANCHPFPQPEAGDRFTGLGHDRLLARDLGQGRDRLLHVFLLGHGAANWPTSV